MTWKKEKSRVPGIIKEQEKLPAFGPLELAEVRYIPSKDITNILSFWEVEIPYPRDRPSLSCIFFDIRDRCIRISNLTQI
jgi:hypothetical protein